MQERIFLKIQSILNKKLRPSHFRKMDWYFASVKKPIIWDVGANIGQSTLEFNRLFPKSEIFSFEPFPAAFQRLKMTTTEHKNIHCMNIGLGETAEELVAHEVPMSTMNQVFSTNDNPVDTTKQTKQVKIRIDTADNVWNRGKKKKIDLLKIDVEGMEMSALRGADSLLRNNGVSFIELELGMNPDNKYHTKFEEAKALLEDYGFRVFDVHDLVDEWPSGKRYLRRMNVIFIHKSLA